MQPIDLLVLQPTPFCNINCSYCYLPFRDDTSRMSKEVLSAALINVLRSGRVGEELNIVWHAGEPLVLPVAYYERMFSVVRELAPSDVAVSHGFQTNGMLITDEWCSFIKCHRVSVGVSIDGPKTLHDAYRKTRSGKGSFDATIAGIRRLQDQDIPFHVISVLTRASLFYPDELFDFFASNGIKEICFNIEEIEGTHRFSSLTGQRAAQLYRTFFKRFMDNMLEDGRIEWVRELEDVFDRATCRHAVAPRNTQTDPFAIVTVAWNGDFSTFSPELLGMEDDRVGDFVLGNVLTADLNDVVRTPKFENLNSRIQAGVRACSESCPYFSVCGGGAPANKLFENGDFDSTETMYCRLNIQVLTDLALDTFESEEMLQREAS